MPIHVTVRAEGADTDLLFAAPPGAVLGQALPFLLDAAGCPADQRAEYWVDGRSVSAQEPVADVLRDGSILDGRRPPAEQQSATWECRVVGGADSGKSFPLPDGEHLVGRSAGCGVRLSDPELSRKHAVLRVSDAGITIEDLGSLNGTAIDGAPSTGAEAVTSGQLISVGDSLLEVARRPSSDAAITDAPGRRDYNRPPRLAPAERKRRIETPREPAAPARRALPLLAISVPLAFAVYLAKVQNNNAYLIFAAMGPVLAIGNYLSERRSGRRSHRKERRTYEARKRAAEAALVDALAQEVVERRQAHPDLAVVRHAATAPLSRLWERRLHDADFLVLRLGTAALPARTELVATEDGREVVSHPVLTDVPVAVSLRELGVLGVAGPMAAVRAMARGLVCQLAVLHSPRDLSVVLLCPDDARADWDWLRWLPHAREGDQGLVLVGHDAETTRRRVSELADLVAARVASLRDARGSTGPEGFPAVVVVLDGARQLRTVPGLAGVLRDGPSVGVALLCLDEQERLLPAECQAVVIYPSGGSARVALRRAHTEELVDVLGDSVSTSWALDVARALAPVRDVTPEEHEVQLAQAVRLLDLLDLDPPTAEALAARWLLQPRSTTFVVGVTTDGPFSLDLRRDGPHGLIAGTTGAGKSELLQSVIAALAVGNRPDALTFVLVDYKGGSAFKDCARLPHTVGMVTDLDGHLVERALASLSAELKRRETVLGQAGAKDIEDYVREGSAKGPLPRLVLVIDEFASLVEELPDFVRGLVGIAQRGRSLGVHLVLATQRPSGVVSPEIRANTNLRIALRVTDPVESTDVVDAPDAATIARSFPGRAYVRTGHASLTLFQSARVGGRPPEEAGGGGEPEVWLLPWEKLGVPVQRRIVADRVSDDETDLRRLVDAVCEAFDRTGLERPRRPWLAPLPSEVLLDAVTSGTTSLSAVLFGLEDHPATQVQPPAVLDVERGSHLLIGGAPRSGRSTVLRTLTAGLIDAAGPEDLHLYGLDCGNGALLPLRELPHCGAVVMRTETERADRLLQRLLDEVARRQERLAAEGHADIGEQRRQAGPGDRLPYLVLLLDRWEGFLSTFDDIDAGRMTDMVYRLLREGPGAGLRVLISGDRSVLTGRAASLVEDKLLLRLTDRSDYGLANLNPRHMPEEVRPGQAFRSDNGIELQVALLHTDPSGAAQAAALLARPAASAPLPAPGRRPFRVDVLPTRVLLSAARDLGAPATSPLEVLVGVGGDELTGFLVDLDVVGPGFTVAGPPRSGRSTALMTAVEGFRAVGTRVLALTPRPSPLRDLVGSPGVTVLTGEPTPNELIEQLNAAEGPLAVVIDDAELLHGSEVQPVLQSVLREGRDMTHCLVVAGTTEDLMQAFRGFLADVRKSRTGLLLSPESHQHGELFGLRLPRSAVFQGPAGRALLVRQGTAELVQVPLSSTGP